jgi:hypothetical protein
MKKQILNVVVTLSVIITLSIAGFAGLSQTLEANIPFDFMVNGKKLSAGKYTVNSGANRNVLSIRSWKTKQGAFATTYDLQVRHDSKPQLIFRRYGNQYFLAKVISHSAGLELPKSKAERAAEKARRDDLTMNDNVPEIVTVSAQVGQ